MSSTALPRRISLLHGLLLIGILGAGGLASWALHRTLLQQAESLHREQQEAISRGVADEVDLQMLRATLALQSLGLMMSGPAQPGEAEFARLAEGLAQDAAVFALIEWQPLVRSAQLAGFEAAQRRAGRSAFQVVEPLGESLRPVQPRAEHVPVLYSWPGGSSGAVGVDMAFDPARMQSKWMARDAGSAMASQTFAIIDRGDSEIAERRGFAISAPVYWQAGLLGVEQRRAQLKGYVAGVVEVRSLLRDAMIRALQNGVSLQVFDREAGGYRLIFSTDETQTGGLLTQLPEGGQQLTLDVGSRPWLLRMNPLQTPPRSQAEWLGRLALPLGLGLSLFFALAVLRLQQVQHRLMQTQAALRGDRERLRNVIDGTAAGTWEWRLDGGALHVNERWASMLGRSVAGLEPVTLATWQQLCHPADLPAAQRLADEVIAGRIEQMEVEFRLQHADGSWVWVLSRGRVVERDAQGLALVLAGTHLDVTQRKLGEERLAGHSRELERANTRLQQLAITDALTGAFNRRHFNEVCAALLAQPRADRPIGLCLFDVDQFKLYNDRYGHQAGDEVLRSAATAVAERLRRSTDALFRVGGEEFAVLFSASESAMAAQFVDGLRRCIAALDIEHPDNVGGRITASFGYVWLRPSQQLDPEQLYAAADAALYRAKHEGRNCVRRAEPG